MSVVRSVVTFKYKFTVVYNNFKNPLKRDQGNHIVVFHILVFRSLHGMLLYGCVSQGLETTEFSNLIA